MHRHGVSSYTGSVQTGLGKRLRSVASGDLVGISFWRKFIIFFNFGISALPVKLGPIKATPNQGHFQVQQNSRRKVRPQSWRGRGAAVSGAANVEVLTGNGFPMRPLRADVAASETLHLTRIFQSRRD